MFVSALGRLAVAIVCLLQAAVVVHGQEWPASQWSKRTPADVGLSEAELVKARDYALTGGGSGMIIRGGVLVMTWGDVEQRYDLKSTTKSFGATALGVAILDGKMKLSDRASALHPSFGIPPEQNAQRGWLEQITVLQLATHTAGFEKPGGYEPLAFQPGTKWSYSDGGPNWLAECITLAYREDLDSLMFQRIFTPLGIQRSDLVWRPNSYRQKEIDGIPRREFGSGISANVSAMARLGLLYLRGGMWQDKRLLPEEFVRQAATTVPEVVGLPVVDPKNYGKASDHYGLLWWNNADGTLEGVPRDAFWSWGLYDSLIVVIPSLDIVVARAGKSWQRTSDQHYAVLRPFLTPIASAVTEDLFERKKDDQRVPTEKEKMSAAPYPPSPVIAHIAWAPADTIRRLAPGSDNWPLTWADDDHQYTAYGDGKGFEPLVDRKLSLGLAMIKGSIDDFSAENLRSDSLEAYGDGAKGTKASGLLMADGVLYLWARNCENSQLAWSADHGRSWTWSDWKFSESFGCPTFLNFGKNYQGARDAYVYVASHDSDSAYQPADRMVLARVPKGQIREREAYQFFGGTSTNGQPMWTGDISQRAAVFKNIGRCYRSSISYNPGLQRYVVSDHSWRRYSLCRRVSHLRRARTMGPMDHGGV